MKKINLFIFYLIIAVTILSCKIENVGTSTKKSPITTGPDPLAEYLWFLKNDGQAVFTANPGVAGEDINYGNPELEGISGKGVNVLVSDTHIEITHEDIAANASLALSRNHSSENDRIIYSRQPTYSGNTLFHGTNVMGIIGAVKNNAIGAFGVAYGATVAGVNFLSSNQSALKRIDQATGPEISVFNYSYGTETCDIVPSSQALLLQYDIAYTTYRNGLGSAFVKSAGNEYSGDLGLCHSSLDGYSYVGNANLNQSTVYPYTIIVGATTASGKHSPFSSIGSNMWITAPGGGDGTDPGIVAPDLEGCTRGISRKTNSTANPFDKGTLAINSNCNYTTQLTGTSFSAPIVSGVMALLMEANPNLSIRDIKYILATTARQIDPTHQNIINPLGIHLAGHTWDYGWVTNQAGYHFSNFFGFGQVDVEAAILMAKNYTQYLGPEVKTSDYGGTWKYSSNLSTTAIPDNVAGGLTNSITVTDNLTIESIQIAVNIDHHYMNQIGIELTSPQGTTHTILNVNSNILSYNFSDVRFLANGFYGENAQGTWTIKVIDGESGINGLFTNWKINVIGRVP